MILALAYVLCCSNHSSLKDKWSHNKQSSLMGYQVKSGDYKRTRQGALTAFIYYIYTWLLVRATTISIQPLSPCRYLMSYYSSTIRLPCRIHVPWRHTLNLCCTCAHHVYTMRNPCPLTSSLTLSPSLDFSRSF